ncbi:MAG TPA: hypothetical protein IGS53_26665 [Leptolyngbyaceae cyanobacterium M33_DOE_097]|uniref:Uncharacterized protein n=1 Tax=Oscillatoriales cyanobacterium SpSt-418 TaxID=2282169 RepID=A0A7C3PKW6_9CYAN|nr:hypothetical protein [Leptolyngbyaceae cyanobacterium M33_DOE_097]
MDTTQPTIKLTDISDDTLLDICRSAEVIACECPGYIARLLRQVRVFQRYTHSCIDQFPEDTDTHLWLSDQAHKVERLLFETVVELMHREGLIDESGEILLDKLSERARDIALRQVGISPDA